MTRLGSPKGFGGKQGSQDLEVDGVGEIQVVEAMVKAMGETMVCGYLQGAASETGA